MSEAWVNGRFLPLEEAEVPGLTGEAGLFETLLVRSGAPVHLDAHVDRLLGSAGILGLRGAPGRAEVRKACLSLPSRCNVETGKMRIALVEGRTAVTVEAFAGYPPAYYENGAEADLAADTGHPLGDRAGHKVLPYTPLLEARKRARERGAVDVIFQDADGAILEGCASNVFVVTAGEVRTPPLHRRILSGVTRAAVLAAARQRGLTAREEDIHAGELEEAEEAFLTGSLMEVMPLRRVGATAISIGAVAKELLEAMRR